MVVFFVITHNRSCYTQTTFCPQPSITHVRYAHCSPLCSSYPRAKGIIALRLHNVTAAQLLKQLWQPLLDHLLDLIVVILLVLLLSTMLLIIVLPAVLLAAMLLTIVLPAVLLATPSLPTLLLPTMLLTTMLTRISSATILRVLWWRWHLVHRPALEVNVNTSLVLFSLVLEPEFATDLLDAGLDLLNVVAAVVALANNDVQVILASTAGSLDAFLEHVFSLLDKETVQVDGVTLDTLARIVLAENVIARLVIVLFHFGGVLLSLFGELVGASAVAGFVGLVGAVKAGAALRGLLTSEIAETVVFCLGIAVGVVERWQSY